MYSMRRDFTIMAGGLSPFDVAAALCELHKLIHAFLRTVTAGACMVTHVYAAAKHLVSS